MEYRNVENPAWLSAEHESVVVDVIFPSLSKDAVRFVASASDMEHHGRDIYARAVAGEFGEIADYTPEIKSPGQLKAETSAIIKSVIASESSNIIGTGDKERQERFKVNQDAARAVITGLATDAQREMLQRQLDRQVTRGKQPYVDMDLQQFAAVIVQRGDIAVRASGMIEDIYMFAMDRMEAVQTEADQQALLVELGRMVEAAKMELGQGV